MSHTMAILEVSSSTFSEIAKALRDAGYRHAFLDDGALIDLHGIGISIKAEESLALAPPPIKTNKNTPFYDKEWKIFEFLRNNFGEWFSPESIRDRLGLDIAASTVRTYCGTAAIKAPNGRIEKRLPGRGLIEFRWVGIEV